MPWYGWVLIAAAVVLIGIFLYVNLNCLQLSTFDVYSKKIPKKFEGYRIIQLSDLHKKVFGKNNQPLIDMVKREKPNVIFITGDMMNSKKDDGSTFEVVAKEIVKLCPVYYIVGNHEEIVQSYHPEILEAHQDRLKQMGVVILDNDRTQLTAGDEKIDLFGMRISMKHYRNMTLEYPKGISHDIPTIDKKLGKPDESVFSILLAHNPFYFDSYARWGADLTLSGHVHGGIIRLPLIGGLLSPEIKFFPKYSAGEYFIRDKEMIVSRGLGGNFLFHIRAFNRPEVVKVILHNKK